MAVRLLFLTNTLTVKILEKFVLLKHHFFVKHELCSLVHIVDKTKATDSDATYIKRCMDKRFNPLVASVAFSSLLRLTPDDFTRQWETSWPPEG